MTPLFLQTAVPAGREAWVIVLPVFLGGLAVYLLLPRPRPYPHLWGAASAALALLLAGWLLVRHGFLTVETVLFYAFSCIALIGGGLLITQHNPVRAALSFALVVLSTCGLFLLLAAPFLMAATIIIYAGAILVTFVFVIMLAQQLGLDDADLRSREPFLSCVAGFVLLGTLLVVLFSTYETRELDRLLETTHQAAEAGPGASLPEMLGHDYFERFHQEADRLRGPPDTSRQLRDALIELEATWNSRPFNDRRGRLALRQVYEIGVRVRDNYGTLEVPASAPLSPYSRFSPTEGGRAELPAENVAYLGRSLFTDYLLAVELGGTLLLVATIGAIAITARRAEGVR
jgi:NADH:ubiquinone oxidoreductase subunit 6 (subunit J)